MPVDRAPFGISVTQDPDGRTRVRVTGELDVATAPALDDQLTALRRPGSRVVLDLGGVSFLDSSAIHVLVAQTDDARRDGWNLSVASGLPPTCGACFV